MIFNDAFNQLIKNNEPSYDEVYKSINALAKKLDSIYYDDYNNHYIISGSFGRGTSTKNSDIDVCYILPFDDYERFCQRKGNIQSQLLSEIRTHLQDRYPNSNIKGDGQVVDALFVKTIIELVPSFKLNNNSSELTYPDTHNEGSWLNTNPIKQQKEVNAICSEYPIYKSICKIIRCWRDEHNINLKGIEIDLLVYDFLSFNSSYKNISFSKINFVSCLLDFFNYLKETSFKYLKIFGENEIKKIDLVHLRKTFDKVITKLSESNMGILWDNCINLFGNGFPINPYYAKSNKNNEQFIQDLFKIRIKYTIKINCLISADGFLTRKLKDLLAAITPTNKFIVKRSKTLDFYIEECDVPEPYDIYWKVRNVGEEARNRDDIRGEIKKGAKKHSEKSKFHGPHYVECYIVKENICVAKTRIDVPIE